jgi:DegV family protein with EDD domain
MSNVCILTDSTAQFVRPGFPGHERVYIIPFNLQTVTPRLDGLQPSGAGSQLRLLPPTPQDFIHYYDHLGRRYDTILVLTLSSLLNPAMQNALSACMQYSNNTTVEVLDSQMVGLGLGMIVQVAAGAAARGASLAEIQHEVRIAIPHIYILFCIPQLLYLARAGHLASSQALVGEMMSMLPIFTLEEGRLVPSEKVRTPRHLFEAFQDFMTEFESPTHIALLHGVSQHTLRIRPLRQYLQEVFPEVPFSEHSIQPHLAALLGPQCIGLVVSEIME